MAGLTIVHYQPALPQRRLSRRWRKRRPHTRGSGAGDLKAAILRFNAEHPIRVVIEEALGVRLKRQCGHDGGEWHGPCPVCGQGTDRLRCYPTPADGRARALCRRCGSGGDALAWAMRLAGHAPKARGTTARFLRRQEYLTPRPLTDSESRTRPASPPGQAGAKLENPRPTPESGQPPEKRPSDFHANGLSASRAGQTTRRNAELATGTTYAPDARMTDMIAHQTAVSCSPSDGTLAVPALATWPACWGEPTAWTESEREALDERAGIRQFDGGTPRADAERLAMADVAGAPS